MFHWIERFKCKLGYIHWALLACRDFKKIARYNVSLEKGKYYVSCNVRTYLFKHGIPASFLEMIGVDTSKSKIFAYYILSPRKKADFSCDVVMSTNEGYRFFNFENQTSLHYFTNKAEADLYRKAYSFFSPFFPFTTLSISDSFCIEKVINNRNRKGWSEKELYSQFYTLFDKYISYLTSAEKRLVNIRISDRNGNRAGKEYIALKNSLIEDVGSVTQLISVFSHGDLHFGNVLFDGVRQYLIDFEKARCEVFFFDLFNVIYVEAVDLSNFTFLNDYLDGEKIMIKHFEDAFRSVGDIFEKNLSVIYLKLFLLLRMNYDVENYLRDNDVDKCVKKVSVIKALKSYIDNYKKNEI